MKHITLGVIACLVAAPAAAQTRSTVAAIEAAVPVNIYGQPMQGKLMPASTMVNVTPLEEISSKHIEVGQTFRFATVGDVVENGAVVIPRGSPVTGMISWKTGRAIGGKSGKFEVEFKSVTVNGREMGLTGKHRQEGRGNTVGALLGSILISGRSAVMVLGQTVPAFTAEPIPY
ncbi:hypothetical protein QUC32_12120 [Novosphingobium resinovorum]|uniref:hypothetical protein n=1 Tax=Sphingomonadaceae TaxID=41297 RepID=UPI0006869195|nr:MULTISPECIES: hypothetical protein [Sphingomonadaceae]MBF7010421.1 hypothetical protein [Novosphingobium sp. HR1a]WJM28422.1 hypothetical protein QUC32_12120 [Novosphingobium resinovorum]